MRHSVDDAIIYGLGVRVNLFLRVKSLKSMRIFWITDTQKWLRRICSWNRSVLWLPGFPNEARNAPSSGSWQIHHSMAKFQPWCGDFSRTID